MSALRQVNIDFFKTWTSEMAYVLGFIAADGSLRKNKRGGCYIDIHIADKELLYSIRDLLGPHLSVNIRHHKRAKNIGKQCIGCRLGVKKCLLIF